MRLCSPRPSNRMGVVEPQEWGRFTAGPSLQARPTGGGGLLEQHWAGGGDVEVGTQNHEAGILVWQQRLVLLTYLDRELAEDFLRTSGMLCETLVTFKLPEPPLPHCSSSANYPSSSCLGYAHAAVECQVWKRISVSIKGPFMLSDGHSGQLGNHN